MAHEDQENDQAVELLARSFGPLVIHDNPVGWGPTASYETDIPYQPFSKADPLGKVADWTGNAYQDRRFRDRFSRYGAGGTAFMYQHEHDENSFNTVVRGPVQKPRFPGRRFRRGGHANQRTGRGGGMQQLSRGGRQGQGQQRFQAGANRMGGRGGRGGKFGWYGNRREQRIREASVDIKADWSMLEEIEFTRLTKLAYDVAAPEDVMTCGQIERYDKVYDRVNTKMPRPLQQFNRVFHNVTTTDDPVIRNLTTSTTARVFATDTILATLMTCPRSVYPWDIVVQRVGDKVFFDKRESSDFDLLSVNETAQEPPSEDTDVKYNTPTQLAIEATWINQMFHEQVVKQGDSYTFDEANPFAEEGEQVASVGYRYRKWDLGDGIELIARCEVDAFTRNAKGETQFVSVKALNEYDSKVTGVDWRQKLDSQKGAVLATELKNNSNKLARWTVSAILAGSDALTMGYVSRETPRDNAKHVILGTQTYRPAEFATQINLNLHNAWGILRSIVDLCLAQPAGKYLILKDPNKPLIRLYQVPSDSFDSDGDDDTEAAVDSTNPFAAPQ